MILDFIFEQSPNIKKKNYWILAYVAITGIHINVNLQVFTHFVSYESEFCFELWIILKTGNWVLSRKRDNVSNSGYVRKWKT